MLRVCNVCVDKYAKNHSRSVEKLLLGDHSLLLEITLFFHFPVISFEYFGHGETPRLFKTIRS